ncbi:MAG: WD40 repeat domain-containing protein [Gemmataceae bacterium]
MLTATAALASDRVVASAAVLALAAGPSKLLPGALAVALLVGGSTILLGGTPTPADPPAPPPATAAKTDVLGDPLPPGALARLGTTRLRHVANHGNGTGCVYRPDGRAVATWVEDSVRLWDLADGKRLWQFDTEWSVSGAAFSPDGKTLAVCSGTGLLLLEAATGQLSRKLADVKHASLLTFAPDGRTLAMVAPGDGLQTVVTLRDVAGQLPPVVLMASGYVQGLAFSPDGRVVSVAIAAPGRDRKSRVLSWDIASQARRPDYDPDAPTYNQSLSDDGRWLATRDPNPNSFTVQIWDVAAGKYVGRLENGVNQFAFGPGGKTIATFTYAKTGNDNRVVVWEVPTCKPLREFTIPKRAGDGVRLAPDGKSFVSVVHSSMVFLWDAETGRRRLDLGGHDGHLYGLAFTQGGATLVSGGYDVRVWDVGRAEQLRVFDTMNASRLTLAPIGRELLVGSYDAQRISLTTGQRVGEPFAAPVLPDSQPGDRFSVAEMGCTADGRTAGGYGYVVRPERGQAGHFAVAWDTATGQVTTVRPLPAKQSVTGVSPDGRTVFLAIQHARGPAGEIEPPGKAAPGEDAPAVESWTDIRAVDVATGGTRALMRQPDRYAYRLAFSADGQTLATLTARPDTPFPNNYPTGIDLRIWELRTGRERLMVPLPAVPAYFDPTALALSPDGRLAAVARRDRRVHIIDTVTGREIVCPSGFDPRAESLAFRGDNRRLSTGHADGTILLWDLPAPPPLPTAASLDAAWADLAADDAKRANAASWAFVAAPASAVKLLAERLKPGDAALVERTRARVADLNSDSFRTRDAAARELTTLAEDAEVVLRDALKGNPSTELRTRLQRILETPAIVHSPELLRTLRAIETLERIATPDAATVLKTLAAGAPELRSTRQARDALARFDSRLP